MNSRKKEYKRYFRPLREIEMKEWRPLPKNFKTDLFEAFVKSADEMVEVNVDELPEPIHKESSRGKSTKQDSFASSFYSWKRKKKTKEYLRGLGIDVLLIRRGEKVALKKKQRI